MNKSRVLSNQPNLFVVVSTIEERDAIPIEVLKSGYECRIEGVSYIYNGTAWIENVISGGASTFTALSDTPTTLTADKWIKVNSTGDGLEETDAPTNYVHPTTHPATMITEDTTHRFVTDTEKTTWNNKSDGYSDIEIKAKYENNTNTNAYTDAEKTKLAGLNGTNFKGSYTSLTALQTAYPSGEVGDFADVDEGVGFSVARYVWDDTDSAWVVMQGTSTAMSASDIKISYESNADTNAYTDAEKAKVTTIDQPVSSTEKSTWNSKQDAIPANTYQPYDINTVVDASYVHTDNNFTTILKTNYDTAYTHSQATHAPTDADNTAANETSHAKVLVSDATGITDATEFINVVGVTETAYNALSTAQQQNGTLYIKTGA